MEINGVPLHPLVVHAAVVLVPLAALLAIAYALRPGWRYLLRWPTVLLALLGGGYVWAARLTGPDLRDDRFSQVTGELATRIATHEDRGNLLSWIVIGFVVLVLLGGWLLGGPSGFTSGKGAREQGAAWLELVLSAAVVVVSLATLVWVVLTGDAGARATWSL